MNSVEQCRPRLTQDGDVGGGPDGRRAVRGADLALVLAVLRERDAADDQVVLPEGRVARVRVARVAGHVALEAWGEGERRGLSPLGKGGCCNIIGFLF